MRVLIEQETINEAISCLDDIQAALIEKGQTIPSNTAVDAYADKIRAIEGGGVTSKDVNFYDYDGTLVAAWTLAEAQTATELPPPPAHERLIFQGWNWFLSDIRALTMPMNVGATYTTASGKSEFDLTLTKATGLSVTIRMYNVTAGGVINVDWGDGTSENAATTTAGAKTFTHAYAAVGNYTVSVDSTGTYYPYGTSSSPYNMFNVTPSHICTAAWLGDRCASIGQYAFRDCRSLSIITIPLSVKSLGAYALFYCYGLTGINIPLSVIALAERLLSNCNVLSNVSLPPNMTSGGSYAFEGCRELRNVTVPPSLSAISMNMFYSCNSLKSMLIPPNITSVGDSAFSYNYNLSVIAIPPSVKAIAPSAFSYCYRMREYTLQSVTPPTLSNISAFAGIGALCKIRVPKGSLEAYQTATNWVTYADYMEEWEEEA